MVTVTHRIDAELKKEFDKFCEEHGLKQQAVFQEALATWLEDARDAELVEERRNGPWVDWNDVRDEL
jgi:predicted transcriptional regulator